MCDLSEPGAGDIFSRTSSAHQLLWVLCQWKYSFISFRCSVGFWVAKILFSILQHCHHYDGVEFFCCGLMSTERHLFNGFLLQDILGKLTPERYHSGFSGDISDKRWWGYSGISWNMCSHLHLAWDMIATQIIAGQMLFPDTQSSVPKNWRQ